MVPRKLTVADLSEIEKRAARALILHKDPGGGISEMGLSMSPNEPLAYGVVKAQGSWMLVRNDVTGAEGWVEARMDSDAWALRRFLPELNYLEGVVGYLRLRTATKVPLATDADRIYGWMAARFADYARGVGQDAAVEATGLASAMLGVALWDQAPRRGEAAGLFQTAMRNMPGSSAARELAAVTSPLLREGVSLQGDNLKAVDRGLLDATALDPASASALANLQRLYEFAIATGALPAYSPEELKTRLAAVSEASARAAKQ
jgi:hypothetical protein